MDKSIGNFVRQNKPTLIIYLTIISGILLLGMRNPALKILMDHDQILSFHYDGAISFCNVLFVGNLVVGIVVLLYSGPLKILRELKKIKQNNALILLISSLTRTLSISLIYFVLERTTVIQVVLVGQLKGILYLALSFLILRIKFKFSEILGYGIILFAILFLIVKSGTLFSATTWMLAIVAISAKLSDVLEKILLKECSPGLILSATSLLGALYFFTIFSIIFTPAHFVDAFKGDLWVLMFFYSGVSVGLGAMLWLRAAKKASPQIIGNFILLSPFFQILLAFLILGEIPKQIEYITIGIVFIGLAIIKLNVKPRSVKLETTSNLTAAKL